MLVPGLQVHPMAFRSFVWVVHCEIQPPPFSVLGEVSVLVFRFKNELMLLSKLYIFNHW